MELLMVLGGLALVVFAFFAAIQGFQAGTPDFSGKLAKPVLVRVVAKQLFYGTGTPLAEIPGLHSQNMRDKPCRIVSAAGNFACDLFRQNFRGFRLTTPFTRATKYREEPRPVT